PEEPVEITICPEQLAEIRKPDLVARVVIQRITVRGEALACGNYGLLEFVADLPVRVIGDGAFERVYRLQQHRVEGTRHLLGVDLELADLSPQGSGFLLFLSRIERNCLKAVVDRRQVAEDHVDLAARTVAFHHLMEGLELSLDICARRTALRA